MKIMTVKAVTWDRMWLGMGRKNERTPKICDSCGCSFIPGYAKQKACDSCASVYLCKSTALKDERLDECYRSAGTNFSRRGANCPDYTTTKCCGTRDGGPCDAWVEFLDQEAEGEGPSILDICNPDECIDCPYSGACPCFDIERVPGPTWGYAVCACGCGREFEKKAGNHKYYSKKCYNKDYKKRGRG